MYSVQGWQEIQSRWQLDTDWWIIGWDKQLLMRVGDCLAQLFIYPRLAKYRACRDNRIIGMASSLSSFSFSSSSLEISNHPYSSWNLQFCSQHILKYFVHKYLKFTLLCPGHVKICEKYGVHMSLIVLIHWTGVCKWNLVIDQCALLLSLSESLPSVVHSFSASSLAVNGGVRYLDQHPWGRSSITPTVVRRGQTDWLHRLLCGNLGG